MKHITVFTSTVYQDVARVWHACISRAFPSREAQIEIFFDAPGQLDSDYFPGVRLLQRGPGRRDFHEAYNDAVRRCRTPLLAICDSDVFWVDRELWPWVREQFKDPALAAVSCMSRRKRPSHGTFSVVLRPQVYRQLLETRLPDGFYPAAETVAPSLPLEQWQWYDSGDRISQALVEAGYGLRLLHCDEQGRLVRLQSITLVRRTAGFIGAEPLAAMAGRSRYFWRGYSSNLHLKALHDRHFADGPRYHFPYSARALQKQKEVGPRPEVKWRSEFDHDIRRGMHRVRGFLGDLP
ncbi:MAG TPA: hypothetical protein VLU25_21205 [Acidobacteriota bacterium]|nr:hypothetical protein [Acidobacteriota bacterium]